MTLIKCVTAGEMLKYRNGGVTVLLNSVNEMAQIQEVISLSGLEWRWRETSKVIDVLIFLLELRQNFTF